MKNTIVLITIMSIVLFSFSSCKEKAPKYTIGVSQCSDDEWRDKMNKEMIHEAALYRKVDLMIKTSVDDSEKQIKDIQELIDAKVDLLIVSPNKAEPITPIVEKAYNSGIPVILVDRKILSNQYTAFVGADNYQIGKEVGNYIVNLLNGKGRIVEIEGLDGSSSAFERHQGFFSIVSNYPDLQVVYRADGAWLRNVAENKMEIALDSVKDIDLVFAHNDRMALGAYNTAKRRNAHANIKFIGIDALPGPGEGIEQVLNEKLEATFIYPTKGDFIIQLALNILGGKSFEKNSTLYTAVVNNTNARILKLQSDEIVAQENKIEFLNQRVDSYLSQHTTQRYLLYSAITIVVLFVGFFINLYIAYRSKNKLNIKLEEKNSAISEQRDMLEEQRDKMVELSDQLEKATQAKLVFFTNISHEFRTPLILISGPVDYLLSNTNLNEEQRKMLLLVQKNIGILLGLINQIIDFRKYENEKMQLNLSVNDLKQQLTDCNESFIETYKHKHINFGVNFISDSNLKMAYDKEKFERIYLNLLSNAFKFTPEKGEIEVTVNKITEGGKSWVIIQVSNTGDGISVDDINNIFQRYYQVDSRMAGSGIGLALVKAFVELHGGEIYVDSIVGEKTTFTVKLPFNQEMPFTDKDPVLEWDNRISKQFVPLSGIRDNTVYDEVIDREKTNILIVDDSADIRFYIKSLLQNEYNVIEAKDGVDALKKAVKILPDLIISDILMPNMDGYELCQRLKEELVTQHIPIILLTACSMDEQKIQGLQYGADDYISKPFNPQILSVRVHKLIHDRKNIKSLLANEIATEGYNDVNSTIDKTFLSKFKELIESKLSESDLNIEDLGQCMGLSRSQLYRKIKNLTDFSPNEYLKIIRLKNAHALISTSEMNVTEIAYKVGFTSASYFTKCYKEYYGETPGEYLKRITKE